MTPEQAESVTKAIYELIYAHTLWIARTSNEPNDIIQGVQVAKETLTEVLKGIT